MNIGFVTPAFLYALSLIAIPIIVHLFNFRKFKKVYFTNVRFLQELKEETSSRSKLKHLLVLLSRILAVIFLVFAFAQPFIPAKTGNTTFNGNLVSVFIDNSFSMEGQGREGTLLESSRTIAREIARSYKPSDRFQLLTCDFDPVNQRMLTRDEFITTLDGMKISPVSRKISDVITRQADVLNNAGTGNKTAVVISDFQESMADLGAIRNDTTLHVVLLPSGASSSGNLSVDSVWITSPAVRQGQMVEMMVRVRNYSTTDVQSVPLSLSVNGAKKSTASVDIAQQSFTDIPLTFTPSDTGFQQGEVYLEDNTVRFDDAYYFSFPVNGSAALLSVNGAASGSFLQKLFAGGTYFTLQETSDRQIDFSTLSGKKVVFLNQVQKPSSGLASELAKYVYNGGSLVIIPDSASDLTGMNSLLNQLGTGLLSEPVSSAERVEKLQLDDPLFSGVFASPNSISSNSDLPLVNRYFPVSGGAPEILMRLKSGLPFLARYRSGSGEIYLFTGSFNGSMSGFARHAMFVPVMYRIAVLSEKIPPLALRIGKESSLELPLSAIDGDQVFKLTNDQGFATIPSHRITGPFTVVGFGNSVSLAGHYNLALDGNTVARPAFNFDRMESVMKFLNADQLKTQIVQYRLDNFKVDATMGASVMMGNAAAAGTPLWKYCVMLALIFLIAEILLLKFWKI